MSRPLPLVDLATGGAGFGAACRDPGFLTLTGHGISQKVTADLFAAARAFFALPAAAKAEVAIDRSPHNRGYVGLGGEALNPASGRRDQKEAFNIGLDLSPDDPEVLAGAPFRGVNLWPDIPGFRAAALAYFDEALGLGRRLMALAAQDLGAAPEFFAPHLDRPMATLRLLRYPAGSGGAGAHTDYGCVTLLATDGVAGLEVKARGGAWTGAHAPDGALIVNIGDLLMRWSNDTYVSTPHRVQDPTAERYSIAFFLDPNPGSLVTPLASQGVARYAPITASDHLAERLNQTYEHVSG